MRWMMRLMLVGCCLATMNVAWGQGVDVTAKVVLHEGQHSDASSRKNGAGAVVVWLSPREKLPSRSPEPHPPYRLVQKDKQFSPHLLVVPTGSEVEFPNQDPFFHNVFSLFNGKRFDLGLYESGTSRYVKFDREGVSYIFCNIHPEMGAVVLTLSTPFYAISNVSGDVVIHNVPPGNYRLQLWSEGSKPVNQADFPREVRVFAGGTNLGTIQMQAEASPLKDHKNKFGDDYHPNHNNPY